MRYDNIRICRERGGFKVNVTDPEIVKANKERDKGKGDACCGPAVDWRDPDVDFMFESKEQVIKFLEKAMDIALPADEYSTAFDKLAKEAQTA